MMHPMHNVYARDAGLWIFGCIAALCIAVSAPATYALVSTFHNDRTAYGVVATIAFLIVLEAGTVASKIATLFVQDGRRALHLFCVAGLGVNAVSNLLHGAAVAQTYGLRGAALWAGSAVYALSAPVLLYLMLSLWCKRFERLRGDVSDVERQAAELMRPVQTLAAQYTVLMQAVQQLQPSPAPPMLAAPVEVYARESGPAFPVERAALPMQGDDQSVQTAMHAPPAPMQTVTVPCCIKCGAPVDSVKARAASSRWGCKACKE